MADALPINAVHHISNLEALRPGSGAPLAFPLALPLALSLAEDTATLDEAVAHAAEILKG